jgi:hypothetical protein
MARRKANNDPFGLGLGSGGFGSFDLGFGSSPIRSNRNSSNNNLFGSGSFNIFGNPPTKKQRKRNQIAQNRETGLQKQKMDEMSYSMQGYSVTKRKTGCDFEATRYNPLTGRTEHIYVESKSSSTAPMRPLQKKMQRKKRGHYRVERGGGLW